MPLVITPLSLSISLPLGRTFPIPLFYSWSSPPFFQERTFKPWFRCCASDKSNLRLFKEIRCSILTRCRLGAWRWWNKYQVSCSLRFSKSDHAIAFINYSSSPSLLWLIHEISFVSADSLAAMGDKKCMPVLAWILPVRCARTIWYRTVWTVKL